MTIADWRELSRTLGRNPDLSPGEIRTLRKDIRKLCMQRRRLEHAQQGLGPIEVSPGVTLLRRANKRKYGGRLKGSSWATDPRSYGPCPICYKELPHLDRPARKYHCHMGVKRRGLKIIWAGMRSGHYRPWEVSAARSKAAAHQARLAIFIATVPHIAAVLGRAAVEDLVWAYQHHQTLRRYHRWVTLHYGGIRRQHGYPKGYKVPPKPQITLTPAETPA